MGASGTNFRREGGYVSAKEKENLWDIQEYTILAVTTGSVYDESGLGYHCDIDFWVTGISGGRRWDVDHLPSGRRLGSFNAEVRARIFIEEIAAYTDWTQPYEELLNQEHLWARVQQAARVASEWTPKEAKKLLQLRKQVNMWKEQDEAQYGD